MTTNLPTALDEPVIVNAESVYDVAWMAGVEERFGKIGTELVEQRNRGFVCCYPLVDPDGDALSPGTVVALTAAKLGDTVIVPATLANIVAGAVVHGVLVGQGVPGARARVAVAGVVPSSLTGFSGGAGFVGANSTTGLAELTTTSPILGRSGPGNAIVLSPGADPIGPGLMTIALPAAETDYDAKIGEVTRRILRFTGAPASGCDVTLPYFEGARWILDNATGVSLDFFTSGPALSVAASTTKEVVHRGVLRLIATVT
jgi:hypothetical protein